MSLLSSSLSIYVFFLIYANLSHLASPALSSRLHMSAYETQVLIVRRAMVNEQCALAAKAAIQSRLSFT